MTVSTRFEFHYASKGTNACGIVDRPQASTLGNGQHAADGMDNGMGEATGY